MEPGDGEEYQHILVKWLRKKQVETRLTSVRATLSPRSVNRLRLAAMSPGTWPTRRCDSVGCKGHSIDKSNGQTQ